MRTELPRRNGLGPQEFVEAVDILRTPLEDDDFVSEAVDAALTDDPTDTAISIPSGAVAVSIRCKGGAARYKFTPLAADPPVALDMLHFIDAEERMELRTVGWDKIYFMMDDAGTPTDVRVSFLA
jgi:hypothetical protein